MADRPDQERGGLQSWPPHVPTLDPVADMRDVGYVEGMEDAIESAEAALDSSYEAGLADGASQERERCMAIIDQVAATHKRDAAYRAIAGAVDTMLLRIDRP